MIKHYDQDYYKKNLSKVAGEIHSYQTIITVIVCINAIQEEMTFVVLFISTEYDQQQNFTQCDYNLFQLRLLLLTKRTWGGKTLFGLHFNIRLHHQKHSRQELKQGKEPRGRSRCRGHGAILLACLLSMVNLVCFPIEPRTICPEGAPSIMF